MAEANIKDIYIEGFKGTGTDIVFEWNITLEESPGVPMSNISSATSTFNIKKSYSDSTPLLTATVGNGITINSLSGILTIKLTQDHFTNIIFSIEEQEFFYDLDLLDDNGKYYRLYKGLVVIGGDL